MLLIPGVKYGFMYSTPGIRCRRKLFRNSTAVYKPFKHRPKARQCSFGAKIVTRKLGFCSFFSLLGRWKILLTLAAFRAILKTDCSW